MGDVNDWLAEAERESAERAAKKAKPKTKTADQAREECRRADEDARRKATFQLDCIDDLEMTEPEFLIDGLLETDTLAEIHGQPGCGKSFAALDFASCVGAALPFHGREVMQGPVVYIAGEGRSGLVRRRAAWRKHHRREDIKDPFFLSEKAANFRDGATIAAVKAAVDQVRDTYGQPRLIVIDTVARNFGAGDENSTMDMGEFIQGVDDLRVCYPGSVILLVHHTGHAEQKRARGSIALKGALDAEFLIEKSGEVITITGTKMKDAPEPSPIAFELQNVELGIDKKGRPFGSAVMVPTDAPAKEHKLTQMQRLAIDTFKEAARQKGVRDDGVFSGVHLEDWRGFFYQKHTGDKPDTKKKAFDRARANSDLFTVNNDLYLLRGHGVEDLL